MEGRLVPLDVPLVIRDLSQGGFSAESAKPFPPGTHHQFRFTTAAGDEVPLAATVIHCRLASAAPDGEFTYITGFEFQTSETADKSISKLMDTLASVLALD